MDAMPGNRPDHGSARRKCSHRAVGLWWRVRVQAGYLVAAVTSRLLRGRPASHAASSIHAQESMRSSTKRHPSEITLKAGCDAAKAFEGTFNTGAYASWGPTVANRVPVHASGPYRVPNYRAEAEAVHTHCPPSGAFRGFGVPQSAVAQESAVRRAGRPAGPRPAGLPPINALADGVPTVTGQVFESRRRHQGLPRGAAPGLAARREAAAFNAAAGRRSARRRAWPRAGMAAATPRCPTPRPSRPGSRPTARVVLHQGAVDIGQGANTVIAADLRRRAGRAARPRSLRRRRHRHHAGCRQDLGLAPDLRHRQRRAAGRRGAARADPARCQCRRGAPIAFEAGRDPLIDGRRGRAPRSTWRAARPTPRAMCCAPRRPTTRRPSRWTPTARARPMPSSAMPRIWPRSRWTSALGTVQARAHHRRP
jgi:hypothetical protein